MPTWHGGYFKLKSSEAPGTQEESVCLVWFTFPFLLKGTQIKKTCRGRGRLYLPQLTHLSACGLSVLGRVCPGQSLRLVSLCPIVSDWSSKNVFATFSVTYEMPISPLKSQTHFLLSPLSKMTFIPYLASLVLEFSC